MTRDDQPLNPNSAIDPSAPAGDGGDASFLIDADHAGARLDKWLSERIESLTRTRIKALIDSGALTRNGEIFTDPSWKLREGEQYSLLVPPPEDPVPQPENIPLDIVYEDADLIVVNKPVGMVVHPAAGNWSGTLVNALIHHCGASLSGIGGVARPGIVHRIDKDTTGLIVAAKNDVAHQSLAKAFSKHDIERAYEAIAVGAPRPGVGTIEAALMRSGADRKKMIVVRLDTHSKARHAVTHYKITEAFGRRRAKLKGDALASLIECRLETGRTHQIRVHLSHIGCPIVGDPTYGRGPGLGGLKPGDNAADDALAVLKDFRRQALHAKTLGFEHPVSGEMMRFECEAPPDFQQLLTSLRAL
jgi:23S rRNA pseudouridine1911/1915/1917 synthase